MLITNDMTLEEKYETIKKEYRKQNMRLFHLTDALRMTTRLLRKAGLPDFREKVDEWLKSKDLKFYDLEDEIDFVNIAPNIIMTKDQSIIKNAFSLVITDKDLDSILHTASYGANYWCRRFTAKDKCLGKYATDNIILGGIMLVHDEDGSVYEVDREKMIVGISKMIATNDYTIPLEMDDNGNLRIDLCQADAGDCELMLQFAIFGKQIYA